MSALYNSRSQQRAFQPSPPITRSLPSRDLSVTARHDGLPSVSRLSLEAAHHDCKSNSPTGSTGSTSMETATSPTPRSVWGGLTQMPAGHNRSGQRSRQPGHRHLQRAAGRGHSLRNSIPGRNRGSIRCCQWQRVRAHATPGYGLGRFPPSNLHLPRATRLGAGGHALAWTQATLASASGQAWWSGFHFFNVGGLHTLQGV